MVKKCLEILPWVNLLRAVQSRHLEEPKKKKAERKALVGKQFVNRPRAEDIQLKGFLFCLLMTVFFFSIRRTLRGIRSCLESQPIAV